VKPTALYRIWKDSDLLYIGISYNPWSRYGNHAASKDWMMSATKLEIEWFSCRSDAEKAERAAIDKERPAFNLSNVTGAIKKKKGNGVPDLVKWISDRDMTQAEFAKTCGVHYTTVSRILNGQAIASERHARMIFDATGGAVSVPFVPQNSHIRAKSNTCFLQKVTALAAQEMPCKEIAKSMGVSVTTVYIAANENGIKLKRPKAIRRH
jgi:DNA-binding transcriptional regulator YdaS (Cro superfamily)/predicted GIY-YIG superfamily endonuclease